MSEQILSFSAELAQSIIGSSDEFPVDFDLAWQWSGYSSKAKGLKALSLYFSEGEDFLTSGQKVSTGGRPSVETFLTADCFKELAMVSRSDQGKKVRKYFLECEKQLKEQPQKPAMSMAEFAVYSANKLLEHESRLSDIETQNMLLLESNDLLKEQVVLLQNSQEALELETDANAAELDRYRNGHGRYYTVAAWCNLHGHTMSLAAMSVQGRKASAVCRIQNIAPQPVSDPRWGIVQSYPDTILMELVWG